MSSMRYCIVRWNENLTHHGYPRYDVYPNSTKEDPHCYCIVERDLSFEDAHAKQKELEAKGMET